MDTVYAIKYGNDKYLCGLTIDNEGKPSIIYTKDKESKEIKYYSKNAGLSFVKMLKKKLNNNSFKLVK